MASPAPVPTKIHFGAFELDATSGELRKAGILLKLQPQPFRVLLLLIERVGQVVTREEIKRCLWTDSTFVDFEHGINFSINQIRGALADSAEEPRYVETIPRRGYRFIGTVAHPPAATITLLGRTPEAAPHGKRSPLRWAAIALLILIVLAASAAAAYFHFRRGTVLTEKDTIVLADFTNTTGDSVLDDTLRQGLAVQLAQSPFINLISDERIQSTLSLMGQPSNAKLTSTIARDLCRRTNSAAVVDGSISRLGSEYVIGIDAVSCSTGQSLAREQVQLARKEDVLSALNRASTGIRKKLGESLTSIQKFDTPLEEATTPSLEALQAYTLGWKAMNKSEDFVAARLLFQRAISLDPNFAMAYAGLGWSSSYEDSVKETRKAYDLRQRATERERFYIESYYYEDVTGNLDKLRETSQLWVLTYPRDPLARRTLGFSYVMLGQYDKSIRELNESIALDPTIPLSYGTLVVAYQSLNRLAEARTTIKMAQEKAHYPLYWHLPLYYLAFLQNDQAVMDQEIAWSSGKEAEGVLLQFGASHTAAYQGKLKKSRELSRQAVASVGGSPQRADYEADTAITEALYGNTNEAQRLAKQSLSVIKVQNWRYSSGYTGEALALSGDSSQAQSIVDDLNKRFPESTEVQQSFLPVIRAQIALNYHDPSTAIRALQNSARYELGFALYSAYFRGATYLVANQGREAAAEFQKILDHRGIVINDPIGALSHLGLARAYVLQGETAKARAAYQDFLALWKDADPDIPILKEAKAEYAKLQ